jgi:hypothetical protein
MTRINVIVEGSTEESFVNNVLAPFLWPRAIYIAPLVLGVPGHKGGNVNYARVKKDILLQLKHDQRAYCSTMLDLYGLGPGFPGMPSPAHLTGAEKAARIEQAIEQDIGAAVPNLRPDLRFVSYLQVHEFEGLLFSESETFASALGRADLAVHLERIRAGFGTPEDINDNPNTAPSKRILGLYPSYKKVIEGTVAAQAVGLDSMLRECPHFRNWVERLSAL